ncbi:aldo/keto reductase [Salmonella enterica subsp. enterica]|nr:aldo/keto reductase [Salmonella enterica subsp. enterica]
MHYHRIPHIALEVSTLGLGTMTGEQNSETDAHAQLDYAIANGINLIDAAEIIRYLRARKHKGWRNPISVTGSPNAATVKNRSSPAKLADRRNNDQGIRPHRALDRKNIREALHGSLTPLQTDYLWICIRCTGRSAHSSFGKLGYNWTDSTPVVSLLETLDALSEFQRAGRFVILAFQMRQRLALCAICIWRKNMTCRVLSLSKHSLLNRG